MKTIPKRSNMNTVLSLAKKLKQINAVVVDNRVLSAGLREAVTKHKTTYSKADLAKLNEELVQTDSNFQSIMRVRKDLSDRLVGCVAKDSLLSEYILLVDPDTVIAADIKLSKNMKTCIDVFNSFLEVNNG